MLLKILELYIMRVNRSLLNDVEKIYFSIPCSSGVSCEYCKNKVLCDLTQNLLKSLKIYYICNKDFNSCSRCSNILNCEVIQKIY